MKRIIHHIRKQPHHVKRQILYISTLACGVVLFVIWIFSLGTTLADEEVQAKVSNDLRPFSALKDNIVNGYKSVSEPDTSAQQLEQDLKTQENNL